MSEAAETPNEIPSVTDNVEGNAENKPLTPFEKVTNAIASRLLPMRDTLYMAVGAGTAAQQLSSREPNLLLMIAETAALGVSSGVAGRLIEGAMNKTIDWLKAGSDRLENRPST